MTNRRLNLVVLVRAVSEYLARYFTGEAAGGNADGR